MEGRLTLGCSNLPSGSRSSVTGVRWVRRCAIVRHPPVAAVSGAQDVGDKRSANQSPKVVVVGGGWAGFGAARHLSQEGYDVTLLDAAPNPGGLSSGWRTERGNAVEAGMKGFWYQYNNIFSLVREMGIEWPFTEYTRSGFWSPEGLTVEGPVFSELPKFPTLLGQFIHTTGLFRRVSLPDQLTMFNMLYPVIDYDSNPETYIRYDKMTARELFRQFGISEALYNDFLKPLLLVGLFAPPEEISAAAMIGTMYFYALAHQQDFDICWCKGSVAERLFLPMVESIKANNGKVLGSRAVVDIIANRNGEIEKVVAKDMGTGNLVEYEADAVVLAISIKGMQKLTTGCSLLSSRSEFNRIMNLKGIDVIATRLWFDKLVRTQFPSNVLSGFDSGVGGTFFNLNELQDEYKDADGTVIAADFYHSNTLMPKSDEEIVKTVKSYLAACEPGFRTANVVDSKVLRFYGAVTHFSPGSYESRPTQKTSVGNLFLAGDWVKGVPHGANGLSQERAYVTGLLAANMIIDKLGSGKAAPILDVEADEPYITALKAVNRRVKSRFESVGIGGPRL